MKLFESIDNSWPPMNRICILYKPNRKKLQMECRHERKRSMTGDNQSIDSLWYFLNEKTELPRKPRNRSHLGAYTSVHSGTFHCPIKPQK
ncbi:unnamed protein product [Nesidiocoris tenuis]|uniref:Uncharacterized protein n=1 Tax=Nesidiocoris tenuis TaxID=355587 RepID=A0A6H5G207_9HEMI|nr:unnamed protein product [Nesidiocoris tenuis]